MPEVKVLCKRLKELREDRKLTQLQLAEHLDIGRASVSNYENEDRVPDADVLNKFADFFCVSTDYLLGRSDFKSFDQEYEYRKRVSTKFVTQAEQSTLLVQLDESYSKIIKQILLNDTSKFANFSLKSMTSLFKMIDYLSEILNESKYDDDMFFYLRFLNVIKDTDILINDLGRIQANQTQINHCNRLFNEFITNFVYTIIDSEKEELKEKE